MVRTHDFKNYESNIANEYLNEDSDNESFECRQSTRIDDFLKNIEKNSKQFVNFGDRPNPYYCLKFGQFTTNM